MLEKERQAKACKEVRPSPFLKVGKISYSTCIGNFYNASVIHLLTAFAAYENGVMPYSGSLMDQPNKVIEVFEMIANIKQDKLKQREQAQAIALKAKHGRRR